MTVYGFSDKGDAQRLKQIARASRPASARFHEALRTPRAFYICLAAGDIPAATLAGGQLTLGRGTAYVLWRDTSTVYPKDWEANQATGTPLALAAAEEDGTPIEIPVYNHWLASIKSYGSYAAIDSRDCLLAVTQDKYGDYHIVSGPEQAIIRFELTATLSPGSYANAEPLNASGTKTGTTVVVNDTVGRWAGVSGYQGWAIWMQDAGKWEILFLEGMARWIEFTLTEDMGSATDGQATASVDNYWGDAPNGKSPGSTVTVYDRQDHYDDKKSGDSGMAVWDEKAGGGRYVVVKMEPGGGGGEAIWCKAYQQWTEDDDCPFIMCHPCSKGGSGEDKKTDIKVYLPRTAYRDPNVNIGTVIKAIPEEDGDYTIVGDYLDGKIGYSTEDILDGNARIGWEIIDDFAGRVTRGAKSAESPLDTGGDDTVKIKNHDPHTAQDDHDDHFHDPVALSGGSGSNGDVAADGASQTSGVQNAAGNADTLSHAPAEVDDDATGYYKHEKHKAPGGGDISNVPAYMAFNKARRIDNSQAGYPKNVPNALVIAGGYNTMTDWDDSQPVFLKDTMGE